MLATNQLPKNIASSAVLLRVPVDISPVLNSVIAGCGFRLRNLSVRSPDQQFTIVVTPKVACVPIQLFITFYASSKAVLFRANCISILIRCFTFGASFRIGPSFPLTRLIHLYLHLMQSIH